MARLALVEDDAALCAAVRAALGRLGHEVLVFPSAELALEELAAAPPDLVLLDVHLPGRSGIEALPDLLALSSGPEVVVITARPTAENAIDALALGASDHLAKPLDPARLRELVTRLLEGRARRAARPASPPPDRLVGASPALLELGRRIGALARSDCTVLLRGESGTGKELAARAIHERSPRRGGPFVAVNCAALPDALFEAELFGHEAGSFTGATGRRPGRVERAQGGTLFLDEVVELSPAAQAKLLRFLEERSYEPVGGAPRRADVRLLAATNAPVERLVEQGAFRQDLLFRLEVASLHLPPLRERLEDLPALVEHLLAQAGRPEVELEPAAREALAVRPWPGNVRQLRNTLLAGLLRLGPGEARLRLEHLALPAGGAEAAPDDLGAALRRLVEQARAGGGGEADLHARVRDRVDATLIGAALEATGHNQVAAARLLGMNRATFRRKMAELGLRGEPEEDERP